MINVENVKWKYSSGGIPNFILIARNMHLRKTYKNKITFISKNNEKKTFELKPKTEVAADIFSEILSCI